MLDLQKNKKRGNRQVADALTGQETRLFAASRQ